MNTITVLGNLVKKPEIHVSKNGKQFISFSLAENYYKNSEKAVNYFDGLAFGKTAENMAKYLEKGSRVSITGSMVLNFFTDRNGNKCSHFHLMAHQVIFCSPKKSATAIPVPAGTDEEIPF